MPSVDKNLCLLFLVGMIEAAYWGTGTILVPLFIRSLNATVFQANLVLSIGGLVATAAMTLSGLLCDRYGGKILIISGTALSTISALLYTFANTWEETVLYTVINMAAFSLFTPARMIMVAESAKPGSLATAFGLMNLAWPVGEIIGPLLGGFIADNYGWTAFFYFLSLTALLCMLLSFFLVESRGTTRLEEQTVGGRGFSMGVALALMVFLLVHVIGNTARGILNSILPFYLTETFRKSKTEAGLFFSIGSGLATLVVQFPSGVLADRLGRKKMMAYSVSLIPLLSLLFSFTSDYFLTLLLYMAIAGLWSATWPASAAYLVDISSASRRGLMMGMRLTAVRLGFTLGPFIGGFLWDNFDPAKSFYSSAFFFLFSFILILLLKA